MDFNQWKEIFDDIDNAEDLDENNIDERIKKKLQIVASDTYQKWKKVNLTQTTCLLSLIKVLSLA